MAQIRAKWPYFAGKMVDLAPFSGKMKDFYEKKKHFIARKKKMEDCIFLFLAKNPTFHEKWKILFRSILVKNQRILQHFGKNVRSIFTAFHA